jgi:hypothetical protein
MGRPPYRLEFASLAVRGPARPEQDPDLTSQNIAVINFNQLRALK